MTKGREIAVVVVFIVILLFPTMDGFLNILPVVENNENRAMKAMPELNINELDIFPEEYDLYYTDNFDLRNQLLKLNSSMKFNMFNKPPVEGKAFIGNDGWMYIVKDEMDIYLGNNLATEKTLDRYYDIFNYRKKVLDSIGCSYYVVIVPIKTSIYPEYLPLSKRSSNEITLTDQVVELLDTVSGVNLIDLRQMLLNKKGGIRLYHKTDNHWNEYGGYVAYNAIIDEIEKEFPLISQNRIDNPIIDSVTKDGLILTKMMGIYDGVYENVISCRQSGARLYHKGTKSNYPVVKNFPYVNDYELVYEVDNDSLPKLMVVRDSFGKSVIPYLSEHFSKSVYIFDGWHHWLNEDIVKAEQPDIYIQLVLESFLPNVNRHAKNP